MNWEQRVKRYLNSFNYELIGIDDFESMVYWKDVNGTVWGGSDSAVHKNMVEWEKVIWIVDQ